MEPVRFKVPDTFAAGLAFRPIPPLTLSFQYDFVEFTDLLGPQSSGLPPNAGQTVNAGLKVDDAQRFRFGVEYLKVFSGGQALSLRGGVWYDNDHRVYFDAGLRARACPIRSTRCCFPEARPRHTAAEASGWCSQPHFQIDAAFDISDLYQTLSVSTIWKF